MFFCFILFLPTRSPLGGRQQNKASLPNGRTLFEYAAHLRRRQSSSDDVITLATLSLSSVLCANHAKRIAHQ